MVTLKRVWSFKNVAGLILNFVDEHGDEIRGTVWDPDIAHFNEKLEVFFLRYICFFSCTIYFCNVM